MICVVRSGSWLSTPLKLCLLPSSCTVTTDGGHKASGAGCVRCNCWNCCLLLPG